jgi:hypothetical protein
MQAHCAFHGLFRGRCYMENVMNEVRHPERSLTRAYKLKQELLL